MVIPRSWGKIEKQHSVDQQRDVAQPAGTDVRFKAGAILACVTYFIIIFDLRHNMHYYKPSKRPGIWVGICNFCLHCPTKLFLSIMILGIRLGYNIVMAWKWELSIFKFNGNPAWFYGLGYAPTLIIIVIFNIAGYFDDNEDQELMAQRRRRNREADGHLGITKRPAWWKKGRALDDEARLQELMQEVGNGRPTPDRTSSTVEMKDVPRKDSTTTKDMESGLRERSRSRPRDSDPFKDRKSDASMSSDGSHHGLRPAIGVRGGTERALSAVSDISDLSGTTALTDGTALTGTTAFTGMNALAGAGAGAQAGTNAQTGMGASTGRTPASESGRPQRNTRSMLDF